MARGKVKSYDDEQLVLAIARGDSTYEQVGERFSLSADHIRKIALGQRRPALRRRIDAAVQSFIDQAHRLGARMAVAAMARLGKIISGESDEPAARLEVQRKAALDIIRLANDWADKAAAIRQAEADRQAAVAAAQPAMTVWDGPDLTELSPATKRQVLVELGGPVDSFDETMAAQALGGTGL